MLFAGLPDAFKQTTVFLDFNKRTPEFPVRRRLHLAAHLLHHGLFAVANAEHRHAKLEHRFRRAGRGRLMHAGRAPRQDHAFRRVRLKGFFGDGIERVNFTINAGFTDPARNQLRHLAAEIDDQNTVMMGGDVSHAF